MKVDYPVRREVIIKIFEELKKREEIVRRIRNFKTIYIEDETIKKLKRGTKQRGETQ